MRKIARFILFGFFCILITSCSLLLFWDDYHNHMLAEKSLTIINTTSGNYTAGEVCRNWDTSPDYEYYIRTGEDHYISSDTVLFLPYQTSVYTSLKEMGNEEILEVLIIDKDKYVKRMYKPKDEAYNDESIVRVLDLYLKDLEAINFTIVINEDLLLGKSLY